MSAIVIGVGNRFRSDDGAGPCVIDLLRDRLPGVRLEESVLDAAAIISLWEGHDPVVVVDAVDDAAHPGRVLELDAEGALASMSAGISSHGFGLGRAIELARALGGLPPLCVIGVCGTNFEPGTELSVSVRQGCGKAADLIADKLRKSGEGRHA